MEKKITASEMVGEIRRAARVYEVFRKAEEICSVIADQERMSRELAADNVAQQDALRAAVDAEKKALESRDKAKAEAKALAAKSVEDAAKAQAMAQDVMRQARIDAKAMVDAAKAEVAKIKYDIEDLKKESAARASGIKELIDVEADMVAKMKIKRDELLKAFS